MSLCFPSLGAVVGVALGGAQGGGEGELIIPQLWELGIKSWGLVARGCLGGTGTGWCRGAGGSGGAGGLCLGSWWGASLETPPFVTTTGGL